MTVTDFLLPVFVQVALTFALLIRTAIGRVSSFRSGEVKPEDIALGEQGWPKKVTQYGNAFKNQFELPVLFYAVCLALYVTNGVSYVALVFAWLFVAARIVHAVIHVTMNRVRYRSPAFLAGVIMLGLMWIWFAAHIAGAV